MNRIRLPIRRPADVITPSGNPAHWQPGRSAKLAADTWFAAQDIPPAVMSALAGDPIFAMADLLDPFLERALDLGDGERPSQTDVMAVVGVAGGIGVLAVEALAACATSSSIARPPH